MQWSDGKHAAFAQHAALFLRGLTAVALLTGWGRWRPLDGSGVQGPEDGVGGAAGAGPLRP
jgi:NADPH:quinone reductase-like Zn-dependent oxidoreductase